MDISVKKNKLLSIAKKYRYSILIVCIGLILMVIPSRSNKTTNKSTSPEPVNEVTLENRLADILSQVSGAGKVKVVLTPSAGKEVIYQTNLDSSSGDTTNQTKRDTVMVTDSNRNQSGLIRQINPEQYQGAIILCQGADDPVVCLAIVNAVSKATGLGVNRISVLKMK